MVNYEVPADIQKAETLHRSQRLLNSSRESKASSQKILNTSKESKVSSGKKTKGKYTTCERKVKHQTYWHSIREEEEEALVQVQILQNTSLLQVQKGVTCAHKAQTWSSALQ